MVGAAVRPSSLAADTPRKHRRTVLDTLRSIRSASSSSVHSLAASSEHLLLDHMRRIERPATHRCY